MLRPKTLHHICILSLSLACIVPTGCLHKPKLLVDPSDSPSVFRQTECWGLWSMCLVNTPACFYEFILCTTENFDLEVTSPSKLSLRVLNKFSSWLRISLLWPSYNCDHRQFHGNHSHLLPSVANLFRLSWRMVLLESCILSVKVQTACFPYSPKMRCILLHWFLKWSCRGGGITHSQIRSHCSVLHLPWDHWGCNAAISVLQDACKA